MTFNMNNTKIVNNNFISTEKKNLMSFLSNFHYLPILIRPNILILFKLIHVSKLKFSLFPLLFKISALLFLLLEYFNQIFYLYLVILL